jgi:hypothetical protein
MTKEGWSVLIYFALLIAVCLAVLFIGRKP